MLDVACSVNQTVAIGKVDRIVVHNTDCVLQISGPVQSWNLYFGPFGEKWTSSVATNSGDLLSGPMRDVLSVQDRSRGIFVTWRYRENDVQY